ncbi:hypothetical protein JCM11641_005010 [Rhodosporidiobolus odoratus]
MSTLSHLESAINRLTPLSLAETAWDNVGLMVQSPTSRDLNLGNGDKRRIVLAIDLTTPVCESALASPSTTALLLYHPPIFSGLKSLTLSNPIQASLLRCIANGVSVFSIHTAADNSVGGVNDFMGSGLLKAAGVEDKSKGLDGLIRPGVDKGIRALTPASSPPEGHEGAGGGRLVDLEEGGGKKLSWAEAIEAVKGVLGLNHIQAARAPSGPSTINTIAICAGSGGGVLKGVKADLWLTGELGHHDILAANAQGIHVFCCNHSATERPWLPYFARRLQRVLDDLAEKDGQGVEYEVVVSEEDKEPLQVV